MFENIPSNKFQEKIEQHKDPIILDVRTPEEYQDGHIPGAVNINIQDSNFIDQIESQGDKEAYLIYCRSGSRSAKACQIMASHGHENLYNLAGGILEWTGEIE